MELSEVSRLSLDYEGVYDVPDANLGAMHDRQHADVANRYRLAVLLGVVAVSFAAIFIRLTDASGMSVAFYRMLISAICIVPCVSLSVGLFRITGRPSSSCAF